MEGRPPKPFFACDNKLVAWSASTTTNGIMIDG